MIFQSIVRHARRVAVFVIGVTVILLGIIMVVGPGPGPLTIYGGLVILAVEFEWARRWVKKSKELAEQGVKRFPWTGRVFERVKGLFRRSPKRETPDVER